MGANPTPMSWNEVLTSLSTGTVEALDHSLGVFNDFNIHEIAPYITLTNHASSPFPIVCSLEWIESLDPEDRALLEEGVTLACEQQREEERANELEYIERFKEEGATVEELTPEETAAFKEAVQPVYDDLRAQIGDADGPLAGHRAPALNAEKRSGPGFQARTGGGTCGHEKGGDGRIAEYA